jgi:hypothetical protein
MKNYKFLFLLFFVFNGNFSLAQEGGGGGSRHSGRGGSVIFGGNMGVYNSKSNTAETVETDTQVSQFDGNLGYVFSSGIYIGGIYAQSTSQTHGSTLKPESTQYGGSLGYFTNGGLLFQAHYFSHAEIKSATATANRVSGSGSQFDIGFIKNLWGPIFVGGQISSRTLDYKKLDTAGVLSNSAHTVKELFPALRLSFVW